MSKFQPGHSGNPSGRPRGSANKRKAELKSAMEEVGEMLSEALGIEAFEGDAHALLVAIYKNPKAPIGLRLDAAKAAVKFEKPALQSVEAKVEHTKSYEEQLAELDGD